VAERLDKPRVSLRAFAIAPLFWIPALLVALVVIALIQSVTGEFGNPASGIPLAVAFGVAGTVVLYPVGFLVYYPITFLFDSIGVSPRVSLFFSVFATAAVPPILSARANSSELEQDLWLFLLLAIPLTVYWLVWCIVERRQRRAKTLRTQIRPTTVDR
jgi:hypothetical protein